MTKSNKKDKMRERIQRVGFVTLVSLFSLSISVDYIGRHIGCANAVAMAWAAVSFVLFAVSVVINRAQLKGKMSARFKERIVMLIANSCSGNYVDITAIIIFIIYIALVPACINDFAGNGTLAWRPLLYICAGALSVYLKPTITIDNTEVAPEDRKVMFSGLSNVTFFINKSTDQSGNNHAETTSVFNYSTNLDVFTDPIKKYQGIQEVAVLMSGDTVKKSRITLCDGYEDNEVAGIFKRYKDGLDSLSDDSSASDRQGLLETLIREYLICTDKKHKERYEKMVFSFTEQVNFDVFSKCNDAVIEQIATFKGKMQGGKKKYEDKNFLFNISPGTSVVTSVMTLNCLKGDRGMIYIRQNQCSPEEKVQEYNPNVFVLDQQFLELTMERMNTKGK